MKKREWFFWLENTSGVSYHDTQVIKFCSIMTSAAEKLSVENETINDITH